VRLEEAEELLVVGDGLAVQDPAARLIEDPPAQLREMREFFHQHLRLGVCPAHTSYRWDSMPATSS